MSVGHRPRPYSKLGVDYANATGGRSSLGDLEALRPYVAAERRKGRTWAQIARASGRPERDLKAKFARDFT